MGHAPATRAYKCTARASRKPCSSFMVLVFSGTRSTIPQEARDGGDDDAQLQPNRGNLYDDAFNRSIKTRPRTSDEAEM